MSHVIKIIVTSSQNFDYFNLVVTIIIAIVSAICAYYGSKKVSNYNLIKQNKINSYLDCVEKCTEVMNSLTNMYSEMSLNEVEIRMRIIKKTNYLEIVAICSQFLAKLRYLTFIIRKYEIIYNDSEILRTKLEEVDEILCKAYSDYENFIKDVSHIDNLDDSKYSTITDKIDGNYFDLDRICNLLIWIIMKCGNEYIESMKKLDRNS
ncbi:MAG: hypothetical protein RR945_00425 [Erysipelotrichaceae bacterium]